MVIGLPKIKFSKGFYQGFILGKHLEHKFERASHERTSAPLKLIHSDIAGPFPHMSMSQAKYALTFIDDFSRYCWVYFLKHKYEVFDLFKVFKALVENQSGRRLKILRSNNGGASISSLSSFNIVKMQVFRSNIRSLTHHNKMVLPML